MHILGIMAVGLRALSDLASAYYQAGNCQEVSIPDTGGPWLKITGVMDKVILKVENSFSEFANTTSGIFGYSVINHEWVSGMKGFFLGAPMAAYESSGTILFVNDSLDGYTVLGFTDLVIHLVLSDLDGTGVYEQPATTTDIIIAPKYELILWKDAQTCTVPARWFTTKDLIVAPAFELAVWVPPNTCRLYERPRPPPIILGPVPLPQRVWWTMRRPTAAATRLLRLKRALGFRAVSLTIRVLAVVFGYGLYLLVVGALFWSSLTTFWSNTGIGYGFSLAALGVARIILKLSLPILPVFYQERVRSPAQATSEDLPQLSDEALEREIAELKRAIALHDANIDRLQSGIASLHKQGAVLGQVEDRLAVAEGIADDILAVLAQDPPDFDDDELIATAAHDDDDDDDADPEDLSALSEEALEREIAELRRAMEAHDARIEVLEGGIAQFSALGAALGRVDDGLANMEVFVDGIQAVNGAVEDAEDG